MDSPNTNDDDDKTRKAFDFIKISELPPKPRQTGIIEIRGPYYTAVTINYLEDLLDMWGDYIDGFKFAGGSQRLLTIDILKRIIDICHNHDVYVSTGGFIERVIVQGSVRIKSQPYPNHKTSQYHGWMVDIRPTSSFLFSLIFWPMYQPYKI